MVNRQEKKQGITLTPKKTVILLIVVILPVAGAIFWGGQLAMFRSGFGVVAEYFVRSRTDPGYKPEKKVIKHVDAFLKMMKAVTGDHRYEEVRKIVGKGERRAHSREAEICRWEVLSKLEELQAKVFPCKERRRHFSKKNKCSKKNLAFATPSAYNKRISQWKRRTADG